MPPLVSVIITTCNRAVMLKTCIEGILSSEYLNKEIIIVDDNSTDDTRQITDKYLGKIVTIHNNQNEYIIKARNKGAAVARGDYLLFVDDDNIIHPLMINILVDEIKDNPKIAVAGPMMYYNCDRDKIWWSETMISRRSARTYFPHRNEHREVITDSQKDTDGIPNVFMIRKNIFNEVDKFDESYIGTWTEADFTAKVKQRGYRAVRITNAETYHQVTPAEFEGLTLRSIGDNPVKAYATILNRYVWVSRYFSRINKIGFLLFWSWIILAYYCFTAFRLGKKDNIKLYVDAAFSGLRRVT